MVVAQIAGGAVLFLVGMQWLSAALREAAGARMRALLNAATGSRWRGLALGTTVGFLAHSSVATVMTVGFVNAGLLGLASALPVLFGANVGTTLSMQLISFRLADYALAAVAAGGALYLARREGPARLAGQALLGFGLLFLGMKLSGDAIVPYRETLVPLLARIDGATWGGLLAGMAVSALVTVVVQSSGAVIGLTFVLAGSGAFTSLAQTYPIVLGAHVGTTVTGLIAALGTSAEARRAALANLFFNLFNAAAGAVGARAFIPWLETTSPDLVHQTANTHTAIMALAALVLLPFTRSLAAGMRRLFSRTAPEAPRSFLEPALLATPEDALVAVLREVGRCARICADGFVAMNAALRSTDRTALRRARLAGQAVREIEASVQAYLATLARGYLSRRQALLAQSLSRCVSELRRIVAHVEELEAHLGRGAGRALAELDARETGGVFQLADSAATVVSRLAESFCVDPAGGFDAGSWTVIDARNTHTRASVAARAAVNVLLARHEISASLALRFSEYVTTLDRIARHGAVAAQEQRQPHFSIKPAKLGHPARPLAPAAAGAGAALREGGAAVPTAPQDRGADEA